MTSRPASANQVANQPATPSRTAVRLPLPPRYSAHEPLLECEYYERGQCRSCTLIDTPQDVQLASKLARAQEKIAAENWEPPYASLRAAFRNKVKLVVTGTIRTPKLGILGDDQEGVDLRDCPLPSAGIRTAIPAIARFITDCELQPYSVRHDTGVLKYVIITESPDGELMIRFVVRRRGVQGILFKKIDDLIAAVPNARVVSMNVQPERKAILEGEEEILITAEATLPMRLDIGTDGTPRPLTLHLRPQSFFQTNTDAAAQLYRNAIDWIGECDSVWDLYCGVGGFALALAAYSGAREVIGVETSQQAADAARAAATELPQAVERADFIVADAAEWIAGQETGPDVVVVNPPRRGIGPEICEWLENSQVQRVLYSSCNIETLARDLAAMPSYRVERAQVVDMFAHTAHFETVVLLAR